MIEHLLTMNTNDERDRLWITCSCGFGTEPIEVDEGSFKPIQGELVILGRAHIEAMEGGAA
jgi:hypothetical protein